MVIGTVAGWGVKGCCRFQLNLSEVFMLSSMDIAKAMSISKSVCEAWQGTISPEDDALTDDDALEAPQVRHAFRGKSAETLSLDDPSVWGQFALHYLSDIAIAYYLQNYLKLVVSVERDRLDPGWALNHFEVQHLISAIKDIGQGKVLELLTSRQRLCVCEVVRFILAHPDYYGIDMDVGMGSYRASIEDAVQIWCGE
jgi:hypothetical protein